MAILGITFCSSNLAPSLAMPLTQIVWNSLYASRPNKRAFTEEQIQAHYSRFILILGTADRANIRYVTYTFLSHFVLDYLRPTSWHGKSGNMLEGGHITVDFRLPSGEHLIT